MSRPNYNEADTLRKGFATAAVQDGASEGDVPAVGSDGELAFGAGGGGTLPLFIQVDDPGTVGAGGVWFDTSGSPVVLKIRNGDDDGWSPVGVLGLFSEAVITAEYFRATSGDPTEGALDCNGLSITNLVTTDPAIAGALWNNAGTPAISTG